MKYVRDYTILYLQYIINTDNTFTSKFLGKIEDMFPRYYTVGCYPFPKDFKRSANELVDRFTPPKNRNP